MRTTLAVKYRPKTFDEVVGQTITTTILKKVLAEGKLKNCILLTGSSGVGKTTTGRIIANEVNHGIGDPIEIDAASNNSVDNIRAIIEDASRRAVVGEYKVYLLDECHMLTTAAWNAFLKTLEEPPKYTIFIFCTTDPQKIPETILNRLQRFNLSKLSQEDIKNRLLYVCQQEGFTNYTETCEYVSKVSQGGMRDALSYLDQIADYSTDINLEVAKKILGGLSYETMFKLTWAITQKNEKELFSIIEDLDATGQDLRAFINLYLEFVIDLAKFILFNDIKFTSIPSYLATEDNPAVQFTVKIDNALQVFNSLADKVLEIKAAIKNDVAYKSTIEIMLLQAMREIK